MAVEAAERSAAVPKFTLRVYAMIDITSEGAWVGQHTDDCERLLGDIYKKLDREYEGPQGVAWFIQIVRPTKTMYNIE